ncbi:MAG: response regulator transcription factor [Clostridium sp.]|nr:response regulator transcription factor [Clostridium sp.]
MINILICDDSKLSLDINKAYVTNFLEKSKIQAKCYTYREINEELVALYKQVHIDIALLDIDFQKGEEGIELARNLMKSNPLIIIIFVTSHEEYAMDAYNLTAFGYLTKPYEEKQFEKLFARALLQLRGIRAVKNNADVEFVANGKKQLLKESSILYVEKSGHTVNVYTEKQMFSIYDSLKNVIDRFSDSFIQVNKGTLVNRNYITGITNQMITITTGKQFEIPVRKVKEVHAAYMERQENL